ncbi:MAG: ParB family protein [Gammaproteobacteria bacterium]|nr:ParB family protein [Gammaproteobacteria bacterium]
MTKKRPSGEQIQAMLNEGHFGAERELPEADPVTVTQLLVEVDRIQPYDHNPRRQRNPQYDEIKASIRAQGSLNNPLTITRRPGDTDYVVESGGNSRLQVLKELWEETNDERFHKIHCLFRPWVSEAHVLTAHLIENDTRGDLIFIDKALAVQELRRIIEADTGQELSLRKLAEALQARGYGLAPGTLSRMDYAVEVLLPLIPETLRDGLGRPQIERLRRLESVCRRCWREWRGDDDTSKFDALFNNTLSEHDGPGWHLDKVQRQLEAGLAEALGVSLKHIRLEVDARLAGEHGSAAKPSSDATTSDETDKHPDTPAAVSTTRRSDPAPGSSEALPKASTGGAPSAIEEDPTPASPELPTAPEPTAPEPTPPAPPDTSASGRLDALRGNAHALAQQIAERHELGACIQDAPALGMGYLVDVPDQSLVPDEGEPDIPAHRHRQWVWWLLLSLSEQVVDPERLSCAPESLSLRHLILGQDEDQVLALVGEPDWKALGHELLNNPDVDEHTVQDLLELARTCRRIRRTANDAGDLTLWPDAPARGTPHEQDDPR